MNVALILHTHSVIEAHVLQGQAACMQVEHALADIVGFFSLDSTYVGPL